MGLIVSTGIYVGKRRPKPGTGTDIPTGAIQFENSTEYIHFEDNETEYITFETV